MTAEKIVKELLSLETNLARERHYKEAWLISKAIRKISWGDSSALGAINAASTALRMSGWSKSLTDRLDRYRQDLAKEWRV